MVDKNELIAHGLAAFDAVVASPPGFRPPPGQRAMAMSVAEAFATGTLGDDPTLEIPAPWLVISVA